MSQDEAVAVITGGAGGLGLATVSRLLADGSRVAMLDRSPEILGRASAKLGAVPEERLITLACDITSRASVAAAMGAVMEQWGTIDTLVNNAGVTTFSPFEDLSEEDWNRVIDVNLKGTFLCCQAVVPYMRAKGSGAIVNLSSQAGRKGQKLIAHYCAAKAGVINLTRALALELAPEIRVNAVCPGVIKTEMIQGELEWRRQTLGEDPEQTLAQWRAQIPLGRFQQPEDIADAIAFLASAKASQITGQALSVDGGTTMI